MSDDQNADGERMKSLNGSLVAGRNTRTGAIFLSVRDSISAGEFIEIAITEDNLKTALSSGAAVPVTFVPVHLDRVGKVFSVVRREVKVPLPVFSTREQIAAWVRTHCNEPGWTLDAPFFDPDSISLTREGLIARYQLIKYMGIAE